MTKKHRTYSVNSETIILIHW